ncbi:MAG TPA: transglutaminase family protein, partial [Candidatus Dormibacteraeota bacterium]|nr:transglutaminase family protein [Candidatus Dormibacteraeota bacterium]
MKLRIVHRTIYRYADLVTQNTNEVRLKPLSAAPQNCDWFELNLTPRARCSSYVDFYFNYVQRFEIPEPHRELVIESVSTVTTGEPNLPSEADSAPMTRLSECHRLEKCHDFIQPTAFIPLTPEVWRLAIDASEAQTGIWQTARSMAAFVHCNFKYSPNSTTINTPLADILLRKEGVCQDFAHLMLAMCRSLKIPARYVSGYIYNGAAEKLLGAQASHAWCEVFVPEIGWCGLDPTNNQPADQRYVKLAVGRDYSDVAPIKGYYRGTPDRELKVELEICELSPTHNFGPSESKDVA